MNPSCFRHLSRTESRTDKVLSKHMAEWTSVKPKSSVGGSCGAVGGWARGPETLGGEVQIVWPWTTYFICISVACYVKFPKHAWAKNPLMTLLRNQNPSNQRMGPGICMWTTSTLGDSQLDKFGKQIIMTIKWEALQSINTLSYKPVRALYPSFSKPVFFLIYNMGIFRVTVTNNR